MKVMGHANDMRRHATAGGIVPERVDEGLVDLQAVHRQGLQISQAAVASTEVIDQYLMPHRTKRLQVVTGHHHIDQPPLGNLEGNLAGSHPVQCQQPCSHPADARDHHITGRQVHRDVKVAVRTQQLAKLLKHPLQHEISDLANLPGIFGQRNEQVRAGKGPVRAPPAYQRLSAHAAAAVELDDRLIEHLQFTAA